MEKILIITGILKEVCPDVTIKVNPKELKFSRAFQVEEFIDMCLKFNERVSEETSDENAALPLHIVSNNEVAVCEHKWIEVTTIADMPNKHFICAKCGISQTEC